MSWLATPPWDELIPPSDVDPAWAAWQQALDRDDRQRDHAPTTTERPRSQPGAPEPTEDQAP